MAIMVPHSLRSLQVSTVRLYSSNILQYKPGNPQHGVMQGHKVGGLGA